MRKYILEGKGRTWESRERDKCHTTEKFQDEKQRPWGVTAAARVDPQMPGVTRPHICVAVFITDSFPIAKDRGNSSL